MPVITIYRQHCSLSAPDGRYSIAREEYLADARPRSHGPATSAPGSWTLWRSIPGPVRVRVPIGGSRAAGARGTYCAAIEGLRDYQIVEDPAVAKKKTGGPTLFGDDVPPDPRASAYPRATAPPVREGGPGGGHPPAPCGGAQADRVFPKMTAGAAPVDTPGAAAIDRAELRRIAAEVLAEERAAIGRRARELEAAALRAVDQLSAGIAEGEPGRMATARAILETALGAATGRGESAA